MRLSSRALTGIALTAVAAATALVVVFAIGLRSSGSSTPTAPQPGGIQATAALAPQAGLFGDTVRAWVDVTLDRTQFDPSHVAVATSFAPWAKVGAAAVARQDAGSTTYLRTSYVLRCLEISCVPTNQMTRYQFGPARVLYRSQAGKGTARLAAEAPWPALVIHSRLDSSGGTQHDPLAAPWRADAVSLPAITYKVSPLALTVLLVVTGAALVAVAGVLAYRARPRRAPPPPPPPPPPAPRLEPIEHALLLLELPAGEDGVGDRRRALELVADEVASWGGAELERSARRLAWSEEEPDHEATRELAGRVRAHVAGSTNAAP